MTEVRNVRKAGVSVGEGGEGGRGAVVLLTSRVSILLFSHQKTSIASVLLLTRPICCGELSSGIYLTNEYEFDNIDAIIDAISISCPLTTEIWNIVARTTYFGTDMSWWLVGLKLRS